LRFCPGPPSPLAPILTLNLGFFLYHVLKHLASTHTHPSRPRFSLSPPYTFFFPAPLNLLTGARPFLAPTVPLSSLSARYLPLQLPWLAYSSFIYLCNPPPLRLQLAIPLRCISVPELVVQTSPRFLQSCSRFLLFYFFLFVARSSLLLKLFLPLFLLFPILCFYTPPPFQSSFPDRIAVSWQRALFVRSIHPLLVVLTHSRLSFFSSVHFC